MKNLRNIIALIMLISVLSCGNNNSDSESMVLGELRLDDNEQALNLNNSKLDSKQENQIERKSNRKKINKERRN